MLISIKNAIRNVNTIYGILLNLINSKCNGEIKGYKYGHILPGCKLPSIMHAL